VADELITDASDLPQAPPPYDTTVAHPARVYNYWLGGKDNFEADRVVGEQTKAAYPEIVSGVRTHAEISAFFAGTDLLPPGVVQYHRWHPGDAAPDAVGEVAAYCGLGRKP
jgi:S-adenosyl methyltransferase